MSSNPPPPQPPQGQGPHAASSHPLMYYQLQPPPTYYNYDSSAYAPAPTQHPSSTAYYPMPPYVLYEDVNVSFAAAQHHRGGYGHHQHWGGPQQHYPQHNQQQQHYQGGYYGSSYMMPVIEQRENDHGHVRRYNVGGSGGGRGGTQVGAGMMGNARKHSRAGGIGSGNGVPNGATGSAGGARSKEEGSAGRVLEKEARNCVADGGKHVEEMLVGWEESVKAGGVGMFGDSEAVEIVVDWYSGTVEGNGTVKARLSRVMKWVFWGGEELMTELLNSAPRLGGSVVKNVLGALKMLGCDMNAYVGEGEDETPVGGGTAFRMAVARLHSILARITALEGVVRDAKSLDEILETSNSSDAKIAELLAKYTTPEKESLASNIPLLWSRLISASKTAIVEHTEFLKNRLKELKLALAQIDSLLQNEGITFSGRSSIADRQYPALLRAVSGLKKLLRQHQATLDLAQTATKDVTSILNTVITLAKGLRSRGIHLESLTSDGMGVGAVANLVIDLRTRISKLHQGRFKKVCNNVSSALDHCTSGRKLTFAVEEGRTDGRRRSRHCRTKSSPDELLHRYDEDLEKIKEKKSQKADKKTERLQASSSVASSSVAGSAPNLATVDEERTIGADKEDLTEVPKPGMENAINESKDIPRQDGVSSAAGRKNGPATAGAENKEPRQKTTKATRRVAQRKREDRICAGPARNTPRRRISHARTMSVDGII